MSLSPLSLTHSQNQRPGLANHANTPKFGAKLNIDYTWLQPAFRAGKGTGASIYTTFGQTLGQEGMTQFKEPDLSKPDQKQLHETAQEFQPRFQTIGSDADTVSIKAYGETVYGQTVPYAMATLRVGDYRETIPMPFGKNGRTALFNKIWGPIRTLGQYNPWKEFLEQVAQKAEEMAKRPPLPTGGPAILPGSEVLPT